MSPNRLKSIGPVRIDPLIFRLTSPYAISGSVIANMAVIFIRRSQLANRNRAGYPRHLILPSLADSDP